MREEKGFTLIELLVVMVVLSILASIVIINIPRAAERAAVTAASSMVNEIQEKGVDYFVATVRELPNRKDASNENYYLLLYTGQKNDGTPLTAIMMGDKQGVDKSETGVLDVVDFPLAKRDNLYHHLMVNGRSYPEWKEKKLFGWDQSYLKLKDDMLDPWGNSYLVFFIDQGNDTVRVFILSAGPNKILNTDPAAEAIVNPNDIGVTWIIRPPKS